MTTPRNRGLRIDALRYSNLESAIGPDGTSVYSFAFDLKATNGAMYRLTARYSDFRRLAYKELLAAYPDAYDWMPRFPPKNPLAKQTPAFLLARGRQGHRGAVASGFRGSGGQQSVRGIDAP